MEATLHRDLYIESSWFTKERENIFFDPSDAADFWDVVNRQDWHICESVQRGMHARPFVHGFYAPMENLSLDIREYIARQLGDDYEQSLPNS